MRGRESDQQKDWYEKGRKDLKRVRARLKDGDYEDAAFHLQQALEKYLKGYLLSTGWKLVRVHDLEFLLDEVVKFFPELERFRVLCQEVTGYYLVERYPLPGGAPKKRDLKRQMAVAEEMIKMLVKASQ